MTTQPSTLPTTSLASHAAPSSTYAPPRPRIASPAAQLTVAARTVHPVDLDHTPHLLSALDWIGRAQDVTGTGGIARGFSLKHNRHFRSQGWQPDYPETTGYLIPTLFAASDRFHREDLVARAMLAATWECGIQLPDGAVRGGVIGEPVSPSVFNTGQVLFGWLSAYQRTGEARFADSAIKACRFLISSLDADGIWRRGHSRFACPGDALYNARTAWALAAASHVLIVRGARDAAVRALRTVAARQHANGWIPDCCLSDPERPLLHTLAYAISGLAEGGALLEDQRLIASAARGAAAIAERVEGDGRIAGRFAEDWKGVGTWSCLTGNAQMATNWIRLFEITGDHRWLTPVPSVIAFLKSTQDRTSTDPGLAGGITGSDPVTADYAPQQVLSWATKFFIDAMLREERIGTHDRLPLRHPLLLA